MPRTTKKKAAAKKRTKKALAHLKNANGRPPDYDPSLNELAYKFALLKATEAEMADLFKITQKTLIAWKKEYPEFLKAITRGKAVADANVAASLYHRSIGYSHKDEKIFQHQGRIIRAQTVKHYPPDPQAASLWLRNRQPDKWRDRQDTHVSAELTITSIKRIVVDPAPQLEAQDKNDNSPDTVLRRLPVTIDG